MAKIRGANENQLRYVARPKLGLLGFLSSGVIVVVFLICGATVFAILVEIGPAIVFYVLTLGYSALIYGLFPNRYEIWSDRLIIAFNIKFTKTLHFGDVSRVTVGHWTDAVFYYQMWATSPKTAVRIIGTQGERFIVTPQRREVFIQELQAALDAYRLSNANHADCKA